MRVQFAAPIGAAWERMKSALFRPFDLSNWLVVSFAAWLAWLGQSGGGGGGGQGNFRIQDRDTARASLRKFSEFVGEIFENPMWLALAAVAIFLLLALGILVTWISSRGKFVFLDSVVHGRAAIVEPWSTYASQGNSLFLWRLVYGLIGLVIALAMISWVWISVLSPWLNDNELAYLSVFQIAVVAILLGIVGGYIVHFLENFVVPIMFRERIKTNAAWGRFLPLFGDHPVAFLVYGLMVLGISIVVVVGIFLLGCLTCCIGFCLLSLPYVWAVLLLPLLYAYRALGPHFLAQFGPEWSVFPEPVPAAAPAAPPPPEPPAPPAPPPPWEPPSA